MLTVPKKQKKVRATMSDQREMMFRIQCIMVLPKKHKNMVIKLNQMTRDLSKEKNLHSLDLEGIIFLQEDDLKIHILYAFQTMSMLLDPIVKVSRKSKPCMIMFIESKCDLYQIHVSLILLMIIEQFYIS